MEHVFEVCIEGVREIGVFASTVWGEADCFIQYHFPTLTSDKDELGQSFSSSFVKFNRVRKFVFNPRAAMLVSVFSPAMSAMQAFRTD